MKKKVTIQDIADALGISRNTVSKAINNSEGIAEATKERILKTAAEMGYKQFSYLGALNAFPDPSRHAAEQRMPSGEIALFTTMLFNQSHFASTMLDRFHQELSQMGYTLNTHRIKPENLRDLTLPMTFIRERVSGIVCIETFSRPYAGMVCSLGIPVLFVDGPSKEGGYSLPCDQLLMDNTTGLSRFVHEMLQIGKRRIGFIGDWMHCQSFYERYTSFRCSMFMEEAPVLETDCIRTNDSSEIGERLSAFDTLPDIFICANDFIALDVMYHLKEMKKNVPEDVWLCGFDDSPESRILSPNLTTVHIHTQIMAYAAAHLLSTRIREPHLDYRTVYTETELIYRGSTPF